MGAENSAGGVVALSGKQDLLKDAVEPLKGALEPVEVFGEEYLDGFFEDLSKCGE